MTSTGPARLESVRICPVCAATERDPLFTLAEWQYGLGGSFPLFLCRGCGSAYLAERPSAAAMAAYYPQTYYAYHPPVRHNLFARHDPLSRVWYGVKKSILSARYGYHHLGGNHALGRLFANCGPLQRKAAFELDVLLPRFVPDGSILEVGCGAGMYLDLMRALGWSRVVGVDTSETATELARSSLGIETHCGRLESVGFPADSFDVVSASHTLEHVHDVNVFLVEVHRILKSSGTLALVLPNLRSLGFRVFGSSWYHLDAPRHLTNFTPSSVGRAVERAGLQVRTARTSARAAGWTALFSGSLARGETRDFWLPGYRPNWQRRMQAASFSMVEHALVASGAPVGEEILLTATKRT